MIDPAACQKDLERLPEPLRRLLQAELAAGNAIAEVGHSHPAAPIGAYFLLAHALRTRAPDARDGLVYRRRNSSLYAAELTDAHGLFFLLEPPLPPPPEPDMDAIRAAANAPRPRPKRAITAETPYLVELDHRGEMLTYRERERSTDLICSFGSGRVLLCPRTLSPWWYPEQRRSQPMSEPEKRQVLERIVDYCRREQGVGRVELED